MNCQQDGWGQQAQQPLYDDNNGQAALRGVRQINAGDLPKLPTYSGEEKLEPVVAMFNERAEILGWDEYTLRMQFSQSLVGKAREFYYGLNGRQWLNLEGVVARLKARFDVSPSTRMEAIAQLHNIRQQGDENLYDYATRVSEVARHANPADNEANAIPFFLKGMLDKFKTTATFPIYQDAMNEQFQSFQEVIQVLMEVLKSSNDWGRNKSVHFEEPMTSGSAFAGRVTRPRERTYGFENQQQKAAARGSPVSQSSGAGYGFGRGRLRCDGGCASSYTTVSRAATASQRVQSGTPPYDSPVRGISSQEDSRRGQPPCTNADVDQGEEPMHMFASKIAALEESQDALKQTMAAMRDESKQTMREVRESMAELKIAMKFMMARDGRPRSSSPHDWRERSGGFRSPDRRDGQTRSRNTSPGGACYLCGEESHLKRDCPQWKEFMVFQQKQRAEKHLNSKGVAATAGASHPE